MSRASTRRAWAAVWVFLWAGGAWAQGSEPTVDLGAKSPVVAPDSPRGALLNFFERIREQDYSGAAGQLDLSGRRSGEGPELARKLGAVLDSRGWIDLQKVSAAPGGEARDGLPLGEDQVGTVRGDGEQQDPVMMTRQERASGTKWVFSRATVEKIDGWNKLLEPAWIDRYLPPLLLRHGPRDLTWWQWIALPLIALVALGFGRLLARPTQWAALRLASRTRVSWDDALVSELKGPVALVWALLLVSLAARFLALSPLGLTFVHQVLRAGFLIAMFWALLRGVVVLAELAKKAPWANAGLLSALPLLLRIGRVIVFAIGLVMVISELGYPVASLIAGLGIGGLALALAAQKTVENLFGSVSIGVDQPFRVGDFVRVEDFVGTVETLGLRSTRIRTLERTLISIPNGKLAEMRIETFAARDRIRFFSKFGLDYRSTAEQVQRVLSEIDAHLSAHPKLFPEGKTVRLVGFGESSIDFEVNCWFATSDWNEFTKVREGVLLEFMRIVERAKTSFAYPTRTLHVASLPGPLLSAGDRG